MKVCKNISDLKALLEKEPFFMSINIKLTNPGSATDVHYQNVLQCIYR